MNRLLDCLVHYVSLKIWSITSHLPSPRKSRFFLDYTVNLWRSELYTDWRLFSGLRLNQDFFGLVEQQYGARPKQLQGGSKDVKEMNDWVSQETGGKVQRLLTKVPRNPGVITVNAAYFKGASRFPESSDCQPCRWCFGLSVSAPPRAFGWFKTQFHSKFSIQLRTRGRQ